MGVEPAVFQSVRKNAQPALRGPHASPAERVAWGGKESSVVPLSVLKCEKRVAWGEDEQQSE